MHKFKLELAKNISPRLIQVLINVRVRVLDGCFSRFISNKARIASIFNGFKNDPLIYPSCQFVCERIFNIDDV